MIFIRRCHKCGHIHESAQGRLNQQCQHCDAYLVEFFYFNELSDLVEPSDEPTSSLSAQESASLSQTMLPLVGFSLFW